LGELVAQKAERQEWGQVAALEAEQQQRSRGGRGHLRRSGRARHRHRYLRGSDSHTRRKGPTQNGVGGVFGIGRPGSRPLGG
jgi:hypothetical protein